MFGLGPKLFYNLAGLMLGALCIFMGAQTITTGDKHFEIYLKHHQKNLGALPVEFSLLKQYFSIFMGALLVLAGCFIALGRKQIGAPLLILEMLILIAFQDYPIVSG